MTKKKTTVMVFGTFDHLHSGHLNFFHQAKKHGNELIVVVARDETAKQVKGKYPQQHEDERLEAVGQLEIVDEAVLGSLGNKLEVVSSLNPDVICLGYDQQSYLVDRLKNFFPEDKIIRLQSYCPEQFKSSKLAQPEENSRT